MKRIARLAVSVGCPSGIGPEVSVAAAARLHARTGRGVPARALLVGDLAVLARAAKVVGVVPSRLALVGSAEEAWSLPSSRLAVLQPLADLARSSAKPGHPTREGGAAQLRWIDVATDLVLADEADALVTGPVSKEAIARSGRPGSPARVFLGHTEHLERRVGGASTMAFYVAADAKAKRPAFTVSLVTTHLPIADVPRAITRDAVVRATTATARFVRAVKAGKARIAVASLNPHAGEGGLLGGEEGRVIGPAIARARTLLEREGERVAIDGPVPAETAIRLAAAGTYDAVVAMYHDQATIPTKLLGFGDAVNVTLGLPIVRTSVDHGTAYDRAGRGIADASAMLAAMDLATRLARPARPPRAQR